MKRSPLFVVLAALAIAGCAKHAQAPTTGPTLSAPKVVWTGNSGGYAIRWTNGEITAVALSAPKRPIFSELGQAIMRFSTVAGKESSDCDLQRTAAVQSVVGSIISLSHDDTMHCNSGKSGVGTSFAAVNLAHPRNPMLLSDIFPGTDVAAVLAKAHEDCAIVPINLLSGFAFRDVVGNMVSVQIRLPGTCTTKNIDLSFAVPAQLKLPLQLAAQKREGFLQRDQPAIANGLSTIITYHYRTSSR